MSSQRIEIDLIDPNPDQPRKFFDANKLQELADSIERNGQLQAIKVRPVGGRFQIVAGERRWRALGLLVNQGKTKFRKIKAEVERMSVERRDIQAIIENLQRADVSPIEEARAYKRLIEGGMTCEELSRRLGLRQAWRIEERIRLLDLEPTILKLYETGNLRQDYASEISRVKDAAQQSKLVQLVARGQVTTYNGIRAAVDAVLGAATAQDLFGEAAPKASEQELDVVSAMERRIQTALNALSTGWKDGECIIAAKVAPDRARRVADQLATLQKCIRVMETSLRKSAAQAEIVLHAAE